jgi:hypothetical protein
MRTHVLLGNLHRGIRHILDLMGPDPKEYQKSNWPLATELHMGEWLVRACPTWTNTNPLIFHLLV